MNGAEFAAEVLSYLDVDGARRGIESFRAAYTRAAIADLAAYIDEFNTGQVTYEDDEETPFDTEAAEAVAEFLKSRIARNVDRDMQLAQMHASAYMNLRRRLCLRLREARHPELRPYVGKLFTTVLNLRQGRLPLPIIANLWMTVKLYRGQADVNAVFQLQRGEGIEIIDDTQSRVRITFSADQTALLSPLYEYYWDVLVESGVPTASHDPLFPLSGIIRPRVPVTQTFNQTLMTVGGDPFLTVDGVPISLI